MTIIRCCHIFKLQGGIYRGQLGCLLSISSCAANSATVEPLNPIIRCAKTWSWLSSERCLECADPIAEKPLSEIALPVGNTRTNNANKAHGFRSGICEEFMAWQRERYSELCKLVPEFPLSSLPSWKDVAQLREEFLKRCVGPLAGWRSKISKKSGKGTMTGMELSDWIMRATCDDATLSNKFANNRCYVLSNTRRASVINDTQGTIF